MYYPTFDEIREIKRVLDAETTSPGRPLLPLYRDILVDLETPVSAYCKTAQGPHSFLLESVTGGEHVARYSFIGIDPYMVITHRGEKATLYRPGSIATEEIPCHDPLQLVEAELGQ